MSVPAVQVSVPATSANLGPGYDSLGLALSLRDRLHVRLAAAGTDVDVHGEGAGQVRTDDENLVVAALRATFDQIGFGQPGLRIRAANLIPHGRGLGSSAAAIVAGVSAALALAGGGSSADIAGSADIDLDAVFTAAAVMEGHPDNVAACVYGGLTISWTRDRQAHATRLAVTPQVQPVVFVPEWQLSTATARALLPAQIEHAGAAANAARAGLLVAVLTGQAPVDHLLEATDDSLHQPFRAPAMPATAALVADLRAARVPAVVSGAGPSVLALTTGEAQRRAAAAIAAGRAAMLSLAVEPQGVTVSGVSTR